MRIPTTVPAVVLALACAACANEAGRPDAGGDGSADGDGTAGDQSSDGDPSADDDPGPVELTVTGVLPSRGPVEGGTWANVIGSGFVEGIGESPFDVRDVTDVSFGDNAAIDIEVIRDDMISVRTPPGNPGPVRVTVENPNGRVSLPDAFHYYEAVRVDSLEPTDFSAQGGTPFTIQGIGLTAQTNVLVGGRLASGTVVESSTSLTAFAPPGEPGSADVEVVNRNGSTLLFRAAVYHPLPTISALEPVAGPQTGGTQVRVLGQGFEQGCTVLFGDAPAPAVDLAAPTELAVTTPAATPGPVDVTVHGEVDSDTLAGAFVFLPAPSGQLTLLGVAPSTGPVGGGQTVSLVGEGFSAPVEAVRFGSQSASDIQTVDDRLLRVTVPAGQSGGRVSVEVETPTELAGLDDAYRYFQPVEAADVEPDSGPSSGGTSFTVTGAGFGADTRVAFGGRLAHPLQVVSSTELAGVTPAGSLGTVDVVVSDEDSRATLADAFCYTAALGITRVEPDVGAQAGGTFVTLYGQGFAPAMRIFFGDAEASLVQVLSASQVTARTPPGTPGEVSVAVELDAARSQLPAGFTYFDPTNDRGGATGGPIHGSINVTALDGTWIHWGDPLPAATVVVDAPALTGVTDERGQVTFSGPSLVREVTLTAGKQGFTSVTVAKLNATNLTVYLYPNEQEPVPVDPGQHTPTYSQIKGRVFGFKDVPGLPTGPTISYEARVQLTSGSIYSIPPFGGAPRGTPIEDDGGQFEYTVGLGNYSIYALYGAFDTESEEFTPALLGVRRNIQVASEEPVTGQNVVLTTPLDQSVVVRLADPPLGDGEKEAEYSAYVSLDLGFNGIVHLGQVEGTGTELVLDGLPAVTGESFLFVGLAKLGDSYPLSYTFRRQAGDLGGGLTLGPFLGFTELVEPPADGELAGGRIVWTYQGPAPKLAQVLIKTAELMPKTLWRIILPGEVTEVELPEELLGGLPQGEPLLLLLYTANSPRFQFDRFSYSQLSSSRWTSYTVNFAACSAP